MTKRAFSAGAAAAVAVALTAVVSIANIHPA